MSGGRPILMRSMSQTCLKIIQCVLFFLCTLASVGLCEEPKDKALRISDVLFRESISWRRFSKFPAVKVRMLEKYKTTMRDINEEPNEDPVPEGILTDDRLKRNFRMFDFDGDVKAYISIADVPQGPKGPL